MTKFSKAIDSQNVARPESVEPTGGWPVDAEAAARGLDRIWPEDNYGGSAFHARWLNGHAYTPGAQRLLRMVGYVFLDAEDGDTARPRIYAPGSQRFQTAVNLHGFAVEIIPQDGRGELHEEPHKTALNAYNHVVGGADTGDWVHDTGPDHMAAFPLGREGNGIIVESPNAKRHGLRITYDSANSRLSTALGWWLRGGKDSKENFDYWVDEAVGLQMGYRSPSERAGVKASLVGIMANFIIQNELDADLDIAGLCSES